MADNAPPAESWNALEVRSGVERPADRLMEQYSIPEMQPEVRVSAGYILGEHAPRRKYILQPVATTIRGGKRGHHNE